MYNHDAALLSKIALSLNRSYENCSTEPSDAQA